MGISKGIRVSQFKVGEVVYKYGSPKSVGKIVALNPGNVTNSAGYIHKTCDVKWARAGNPVTAEDFHFLGHLATLITQEMDKVKKLQTYLTKGLAI